MTDPRETPATSTRRSWQTRLFRALHISRKVFVRTVGAVIAAAVVVIIASFFIDGPLRRSIERGMNESLTGYTVRVPSAHFQLFALAVTLRDLQIAQEANPDPPVAVIPHLRASLQWRELLSLHLVSDFKLTEPRINVNLTQLRHESNDEVRVQDRGWQKAAEEIFPFKINLFHIVNGDLVYVDDDPSRPLHVASLEVRLNNLRNIHSKDNEYPSPVHAEGVVFDRGHATIDGHADFLAQPSPTFQVKYTLADVPVENLNPIAERSNLTIKGGTLASDGEVESGLHMKAVNVHHASVTNLRADYHHMLPRALGGINKAVASINNKPAFTLRVDTVDLVNSELGMLRQKGSHPYRMYFSHANVHLTNYSNQFTEGAGDATLRAEFMGSGRTAARAHFRPERTGPDFDVDLAIENTNLTSMNEMLRAHGKVDVAKGKFFFYSQLSVANDHLTGYVKPIFEDMTIYSWHQDKHNNVFNQLYELIVSGTMKLLENHRTGRVASRAVLAGNVGSTNASAWELILNAFENAFIKTITPGFDRVLGKNSKGAEQ
jgi:hypothetical protein